jgi:hypothetical protein
VLAQGSSDQAAAGCSNAAFEIKAKKTTIKMLNERRMFSGMKIGCREAWMAKWLVPSILHRGLKGAYCII